MKAKFKKFLTNNRAYSKFVRNVKDQRNMSFDEYCSKDGIGDRTITSAFNWGLTPLEEDFLYWSKLNEKWLKLLNDDQTT